ncbi:hypothetical protein Abr02nite_18800 [Paractinoplanes brasiliensis]|nr:hypothetical protein Abr02nite_18800 [Actinoplanes brasiliensis]
MSPRGQDAVPHMTGRWQGSRHPCPVPVRGPDHADLTAADNKLMGLDRTIRNRPAVRLPA